MCIPTVRALRLRSYTAWTFLKIVSDRSRSLIRDAPPVFPLPVTPWGRRRRTRGASFNEHHGPCRHRRRSDTHEIGCRGFRRAYPSQRRRSKEPHKSDMGLRATLRQPWHSGVLIAALEGMGIALSETSAENSVLGNKSVVPLGHNLLLSSIVNFADSQSLLRSDL